jgi:hypothetical protein
MIREIGEKRFMWLEQRIEEGDMDWLQPAGYFLQCQPRELVLYCVDWTCLRILNTRMACLYSRG